MGSTTNCTRFKFFYFPVLPLTIEGAEKEKNLKISSMGLRGKEVQFVVNAENGIVFNLRFVMLMNICNYSSLSSSTNFPFQYNASRISFLFSS